LTASISAVVLRNLSGGGHCTSFYRCTIVSCIIFTSIGYFSGKLQLDLDYVAAIYLIMLLLLAIWAPVSNRRWNYRKRIFFKITSCIYLLIFLVLSFLLHTKEDLVIAVMSGLVWQVFTITPMGFYLINKIDYSLSERRGNQVCFKE